ncbi:Holliday junction branch migration protein RuvA [Patescibacteria group bacterium]|nr:Holliday junction branch migration protein RuvA [Patescibacteria group bacterium]
MLSFLQGKIILKREKFIILGVNGLGFEIFLSQRSLDKIPQIKQNLKLFCYLDVGERSLKLYGFLTYEELELFGLLRNISGVGPKAALEISSIGSPEKIKKEIEKGNEKIFVGVPGIGQKKARKIILELSGKLKSPESSPKKETIPEDEAFLALVNLGFPREEAKKALAQLPKEIKNSQERIKQTLKILGRR